MDGNRSEGTWNSARLKRSYSAMASSHEPRNSTILPDLQQNSNHSSSSNESRFVSSDYHYNNGHDSRRSRLVLPPLTSRFPGDGLDFRRPIMNSINTRRRDDSSTPVIDLTREESGNSQNHSAGEGADEMVAPRAQRLPRFDRDIIDLVSDGVESSPPLDTMNNHLQTHNTTAPLARNTPQATLADTEVEIVGERSSSATAQVNGNPVQNHGVHDHGRIPPFINAFALDTIDLSDDDDDDVVITSSRSRLGGVNAEAPATTVRLGTHNLPSSTSLNLRRTFDLITLYADVPRLRHRLLESAFEPSPAGQNRSSTFATATPEERMSQFNMLFTHTTMPGEMDYRSVPFSIGSNRPPTPKYEAPPPPQEGFTRNPEENEEVVCPNCGDELALGASEEKREVWVIKGCGHAYCGECTHNRFRSVSRKGKDRSADVNLPPPFKTCVVEGCGKPASAKSMTHVYLSS